MKKLLILLVIFMTVFGSCSHSANFMGADLTWTCVGQDSFLVKLVVYRDCNGLQFSSVSIPIKCAANGTTITTLSISKPSPINITPTCLSNCTRCDSASCSFPYGIEQYVYTKLVVFDTSVSCCKLIMSYSLCCRSSSITTGPAGTNFYTEARMNRCLSSPDNSPDFTIPPVAILCIGQDFTFNHGAFDIDTNQNGGLLDSLSFECTCPKTGSSSYVSYIGQYSCCNPIYFWGFPNSKLPFPRGLHLDNLTGDISVRPMKIEETVMAIKVTEWRKINGVRTNIGEVRRDMQIIVISCPNNHAPLLSGSFYKEICAGSTVTFSIATNDYDTKDTLTISCNHNLPGASWSENNGNVKHPTGTLSWTPNQNSSSTIPHVFTVTVKDDACPVNGKSTRAYQILVKPIPKADITVVDSGCGNIWLYAQATKGNSPSFQWTGNFIPGFSMKGSSMNYKFDKAGKYPYSLTMEAQQCQNKYFDTIEIVSFSYIGLPEDTFICAGNDFTIHADLSHFDSNSTYYWSTGDSNISSQTLVNIQSDTIVEVYFRDSNLCYRNDQIYIKVFQNPILNLSQPNHVCMKDSLKLSIQYVLDNAKLKQITWTDILRNNNLGNQSTQMVSDSGLYSVQLWDDHACSSTDSFDVAISNLKVELGNTLQGCPTDTFIIIPMISNSEGQNSYLWSNGDTTKIGTITNLVKDDYITLTVQDFRNCPVSEDVWIDVSEMDLFLGDDKYICQGETATLIANNFLNPVESNPKIEWYSLDDSTFYDTSKVISTKKSNHFRCFLTNKENCQIWEDVSVIVQSLPTVNAGVDDTFCATDNMAILYGTPNWPEGIWSGKGVSLISGKYIFDPGNKTIFDGENCPLIYSYTASNGCKNKDTLYYKVFNPSFTVYPLPYKQICINQDPVFLTGSPEGGFYTGYGVINEHYFDPSLTGAGKQTIYYHVGPFRCRRTKAATIDVVPLPHVLLSASNGKTVFCKEEGLVRLLFSPVGGVNGGYLTGPVINNQYFNADTIEGIYQISYHFKDNIGCSDSAILNLMVKQPYVEILKDVNSVCKGNTIEISADYDVVKGIQWQNESGSDGYFSGSTTSKEIGYRHGSYEANNHGFWLKVKTTDPVCQEVSDSIWIEIGEYPKAGFNTDILSGIEPLNVQFTDSSSIPYGVISNYQWKFGDGDSSNWKNPLHQYQQTGLYDVKLTVYSDLNCVDSVLRSKLIDVWSVGFEESGKTKLIVFPNPVKERLIIQSDKIINSIQFFDAVGKEDIFIKNINQTDFYLNTTNLCAGLWILKIEFKDASIESRKIIIESD